MRIFDRRDGLKILYRVVKKIEKKKIAILYVVCCKCVNFTSLCMWFRVSADEYKTKIFFREIFVHLTKSVTMKYFLQKKKKIEQE